MIAPLTVVVALTLRFVPALQPAFRASPPRLRMLEDAVIGAPLKENFWTLSPFTFAAFAALVAFGTVSRLDSRMFAPVSASVPTSWELIARGAILDLVTLPPL